MRKDSTIILLVSVLITALVIGGAYYMSAVRPSASSSRGTTNLADTGSQANSNTPNDTIGATSASAKTGTDRTGTPIKCQHPEIGEFWTNAATCEGADLDNRLSYSAPVAGAPQEDRYNDRSYKTPAQMAADSRSEQKPNLRLMGKPPPDGLPTECNFPVGKALEIERLLAAANNPYESEWRDSYCEFRCEVIGDECPIRDDYFYYEFRLMCDGTEHFPCYRPNS